MPDGNGSSMRAWTGWVVAVIVPLIAVGAHVVLVARHETSQDERINSMHERIALLSEARRSTNTEVRLTRLETQYESVGRVMAENRETLRDINMKMEVLNRYVRNGGSKHEGR